MAIQLRQDRRTGLFTRCSQLPDKVGQGRCTHVDSTAVKVDLDKDTNILIIDAGEARIKMTTEEVEKAINTLRERAKEVKLKGLVEVSGLPKPKPGKVVRVA